jgi:uncharacterized membrane protein YdjX (TVP38/TMEM64 family)
MPTPLRADPDREGDRHDAASGGQRSERLSLRRLAPLLVLILLGGLLVASGLHRQLSLETLVRHRAALDAFIAANHAGALIAFILIYATAVSLSVPGAVFLTIAGGILFGWIVGGIAVVIAATAGATVIFLLAKSAFGEFFLRRAGTRLSKVMRGFRSDAFSYLLFLRLVPLFPFFLVNLAPALVGIPLSTFVVATALGIVPGTFVFASVGAGLDSVIAAQSAAYQACIAAGRADCRLDFDASAALTPQLIAALTALGLLALVPVIVKRVYMRGPGTDTSS